jgi:hypothetical protein
LIAWIKRWGVAALAVLSAIATGIGIMLTGGRRRDESIADARAERERVDREGREAVADSLAEAVAGNEEDLNEAGADRADDTCSLGDYIRDRNREAND